MTDSREKFCVRASEGIGTGELAAIIEGGSTLRERFEKVVGARTHALSVSNKAREDLIAIRATISTTCCTAMIDKPSVLAQIDKVISDLSQS